ncbi:ABC transporter G family member 29 [Phytophthora nicotianae]|uniref:Probable pectate lyase F n=1 Tax=Phytophthora nicotianae TaxID=4792 RepID=A0A0W8CMF7_PHYNI|nr:ABC transporter G family member 29 [Phytophthora nicotianae]
MVKSFVPFATLLLATASAASVPDGTWPTSTGTVQYAEAYIIKAGEVFDGKMQTFERSDVSCEGQTESGADTAVFKMEPGATLKNAIIGKNQMEGVHCDKHDCTIENVWWDDVCEDALSIKGGTASSVSTVTGGGARSADDKVIQHNGYGTVKIDGFYGEDISKLYRSCGTCGDRPKKVSVSNVYVVKPGQCNRNGEQELERRGHAEQHLGDWHLDVELVVVHRDAVLLHWISSYTDDHLDCLVTGICTVGSTPTNSSTAASDSNVPGTVAPAGSNSNSEQTSVSTESSQTQQNETSDESNDETTQTQQSTTSSNKNGDSDDAQNEEQTITASGNGSTTSDAGTSTTESSTAGSTTQASSDDSTTQNSSAGSTTQSSGTGSTAQTSTNSSTSTSTGSVPDGTWPASTGTVQYTEPHTIKAGEVFDGKMQTFERSDITCSGGEGQKDTAVFLVEAGGTLKNAIIGKNQKEGVHCDDHDCTIENVWWDDVCEDALSIKGGTASSVTTVTNCGARYASDKVVQHNGYGTVKIDGFFAQEFGKLYRSCGTCGDIPRTVTVDNVYAIDPLVSVITVNKNYGDQAKLSNIHVKTTNGNNDVKVCQWSQGGSSPSNLGDGPSGTLCQYSESDVHINE